LWFLSRSVEQTRAAARLLGGCVDARGLVIALVGPLGAGKTVFVKGLAEGLGVDARLVASPSFVIASEYPGARRLAHVDLYRVSSEAELEAAGFLDLLEPGGVVAVEWADRLPGALPKDRLEVTIEPERPNPGGGEPARRIAVRTSGAAARDAAVCWRLGLERSGLLAPDGARSESGRWP
jgi:tRNA threonylcarbamoyladenosine biosynthesis protein TsaE